MKVYRVEYESKYTDEVREAYFRTEEKAKAFLAEKDNVQVNRYGIETHTAFLTEITLED